MRQRVPRMRACAGVRSPRRCCRCSPRCTYSAPLPMAPDTRLHARARARTRTHGRTRNTVTGHTAHDMQRAHSADNPSGPRAAPTARRRRIRSTRRAPRRCCCRSTLPRCSMQRLCRCCCPRDPHARSWPRSSCTGVARAGGPLCASQPLWSAVATCRCRPDTRACAHQCVHLPPSRSAAYTMHAHTPSQTRARSRTWLSTSTPRAHSQRSVAVSLACVSGRVATVRRTRRRLRCTRTGQTGHCGGDSATTCCGRSTSAAHRPSRPAAALCSA